MKKRIEDYPISVLEAVEQVFAEIRKIIAKEYSLVEEVKSKEFIELTVKGRSLSKFHFKIASAKLDTNKSKVVFTINRKPANDKDVNEGSLAALKDNTIGNFKQWINTLKRYSKINFNDPFINEYEERYFEKIKLLDKDADINPFSIEQQIGINNYLHLIEKHISENYDEDEYTQIIINEIHETKAEIGKAPKNVIMRRISRIWAFGTKQGPGFVKELIDIFRKEIIKKALWAGVDKITDLYNMFKNLLE